MTGYEEYEHVYQLKINYQNLTESKILFLMKKDLSLTGVMGDVSPLFDIFKFLTSTYQVYQALGRRLEFHALPPPAI